MVAGGFQVVVRGTTPKPMAVEFHDLPIGVAAEDYQGVEFRARAKELATEVETPWTLERDSQDMPHGRVGFVLIGETKRAFFPPEGS